ncbi:MAG: DUF5056 domain-containing protein [Prevotella sp.]|nr:DUF5056 domain-containing protein [Prevotella sp.]
MTNNNDAIISKLFEELREKDIPDNGFSRKTMNSLPDKVNRISRLWTAFCILLGVILMFVFNIWQLIAVYISVFIQTLPVLDMGQILCLPLISATIIMLAIYTYHEIDSESWSL